jgi:hypothetical protein
LALLGDLIVGWQLATGNWQLATGNWQLATVQVLILLAAVL